MESLVKFQVCVDIFDINDCTLIILPPPAGEEEEGGFNYILQLMLKRVEGSL